MEKIMDILKLETLYRAEGFEALIQSLLKYIAQNNLAQQDAEKLMKNFFTITAGGGDCFDSSAGILFKKLQDKFPQSKILTDYFKDIYSELENNGNIDDFIKLQKYSSQNVQKIERTQTYKTETILEKINTVIKNTINSYNNDYSEIFEKIIIDARCMCVGLNIATYFVKGNETFKIKGNIDTFYLMNDIKDEMYKQKKHEGAWFFCTIEVLPSLEYNINFNYDEKDKLPEERLKSSDNFINEFSEYPRSKNFTPTWWQNILGKEIKYIKK
jgi:hypothetical protein